MERRNEVEDPGNDGSLNEMYKAAERTGVDITCYAAPFDKCLKCGEMSLAVGLMNYKTRAFPVYQCPKCFNRWSCVYQSWTRVDVH